jgi:hypothetical protein
MRTATKARERTSKMQRKMTRPQERSRVGIKTWTKRRAKRSQKIKRREDMKT